MNEQKLNKGTWTAKDRQERVDALRDFVKKKGQALRKDVYRYMLQSFGISVQSIDDYIDHLCYAGFVELKEAEEQFPLDSKKNVENQTLVWRGEGE